MDEVLQVGAATVSPVHQMVGVGERHRTIAARPLTAPRPSPQRRPRRRTRYAERPADVDHGRAGAEEDTPHPGITGETLHGGGGHRAAELEIAPDAPFRPITVSTEAVSWRWVLAPPVLGIAPRSRAWWAISTSASAMRRGSGRSSPTPPGGPGGARRS